MFDFQRITMTVWNWLWSFLEQFRPRSTTTSSDRASSASKPSSPTVETNDDFDFDKLLRKIEDFGDYDHHDILRRSKKKGWYEWHLNADSNVDAVKIAQRFHENKEKLNLSSSIVGIANTIEEMVSKLSLTDRQKADVEKYLAQAQREESLLPIIKIYTLSQKFSECLNKYLALNTRHTLDFYCTSLNCPALARTEEYTDTFTSVLLHPQFEKYVVRQRTVHRGFSVEDKKLIENYSEGAIIITTTVLSTSEDPEVAEQFINDSSSDIVSASCTYNINNTKRRTILQIQEISHFSEENEILILPYIPFIIQSVEHLDDGRPLRIVLQECDDRIADATP